MDDRKPSGQVIQENEEATGSDLAPVFAETGPVLKIQFVDGKNGSVTKQEAKSSGND
jgi:hypothetical protein